MERTTREGKGWGGKGGGALIRGWALYRINTVPFVDKMACDMKGDFFGFDKSMGQIICSQEKWRHRPRRAWAEHKKLPSSLFTMNHDT